MGLALKGLKQSDLFNRYGRGDLKWVNFSVNKSSCPFLLALGRISKKLQQNVIETKKTSRLKEGQKENWGDIQYLQLWGWGWGFPIPKAEVVSFLSVFADVINACPLTVRV